MFLREDDQLGTFVNTEDEFRATLHEGVNPAQPHIPATGRAPPTPKAAGEHHHVILHVHMLAQFSGSWNIHLPEDRRRLQKVSLERPVNRVFLYSR